MSPKPLPRLLSVLAAGSLVVAAALVAPSAAQAADPVGDPARCGSQVPDAPVVSSSAEDPLLYQGGLSRTLVRTYSPGVTGSGTPGAAFPSLFAWDTATGPGGAPNKTVATAFDRDEDVPSAAKTPYDVFSTDGGKTFPASSLTTPATVANAVRMLDGRIASVHFRPEDRSPDRGRVFRYQGAVSDTAGTSFTHRTVTLTAAPGYDRDGSWTRIGGQGLALGDGTVLLPYYGKYAGPDTSLRFRAELAISRDGGATYSHLSTIIAPEAYDASEVGLAQLPNGVLIAIVRTENSATGHRRLQYVRSTDWGKSWSAPVDMRISLDGSSAQTRFGVTPTLQVMPSGLVVLASGRPDTWVAMSPTGGPDDFRGMTIYRNCPVDGDPIHGSSANTGLAITGPTSLLQSGDNCAPWGCDKSGTYTVSREHFTWARFLEALPAGTGRMDLTGMLRSGSISVSTNMTWTGSGHPRTGSGGALDGSLEYWSSAVASGTDGTYTIDLHRPYRLTRIGLSLTRSVPAAATVETSLDGTTWTPLTSRANHTSYALSYTDLSGNAARYVRIRVPRSTACQGAMSSCAILNEVELWSDEDSFENDPLLNRPRGYVDDPSDPADAQMAWIEERGLTGSSRALRIVDDSTTAQAHIRRALPASTSRTLSFTILPQRISTAAMFDLTGGGGNAYHLAVFPDGSLRAWNGTAWTVRLAAGTVPTGRATRITLTATPGGATVSVGAAQASVPSLRGPSPSIDGLQFSSGGTATTGDDVLIDDVSAR